MVVVEFLYSLKLLVCYCGTRKRVGPSFRDRTLAVKSTNNVLKSAFVKMSIEEEREKRE